MNSSISSRSLTDDVTAIVISYNSEDRIAGSIAALETAFEGLEAEILVVDNASSDRSVEVARSALTIGRVIANDENLGYGKAANMGIEVARGDTCLILNDDARLDGKALRTLMEVLHSAVDVALVGPRIVNENGEPMPSARTTFPGLGEEWQRMGDVLRGINRNNLYPAETQEPMDVAWLVAACVLGKTETLCRVGGFNPAFFLYAEDIDLSRRLHETGHRVLTVPEAVCVHTGSVSTSDEFGSARRIDRRTNARDLYYRIWQSRPARSLIHLRRAFGVSNQPKRLRHHLPKVIWDGESLSNLRMPPALKPPDGPG